MYVDSCTQLRTKQYIVSQCPPQNNLFTLCVRSARVAKRGTSVRFQVARGSSVIIFWPVEPRGWPRRDPGIGHGPLTGELVV